MLKYEYVTVKFTFTLISGIKCTEHREIINNYAQKGYKYVGFIPIDMTAHGVFKEIDLIFEKQE